ncbi:recombination mediator RecR [Nitratifractor sp.]|uniref:recombination mediator RecR n=1 Tax=Nitratifractor sp. TaxID=2268144 RepID=UPI0025E0D50E|nr:recombination mediator RecR [Nitratifractor sp.]
MRRYRVDAFEQLVEALNSLPTIGRKSALRLAYHMVQKDSFGAMKLSHAIEHAVATLQSCRRCHTLSEDELCTICSDESRDRSKLCLVQSARDIFAIEESGQYDGLYYIVASVEDLDEAHLCRIVEGVEEVIFAFPPGIASDTMTLYIESRLEGRPLRFTRIAQGVPTGVELENIDLLSLGRALEDRVEI